MGAELSRRSLFGAGALLAIPSLSLAESKARPKNVIFCVSDGMSLGALSLADQLNQVRDGRPSYWARLTRQVGVVNGLQETRSLNSVVTDSSAAASAWGSGRRIWNGQVNMFPDGTKLRTLTQLMVEAGVRCGLVTTATITHATPAGFCVNAPSRDDQDRIAVEYLTSGVDVLMGGGSRHFDPAERKDKRDLYAEFSAKGYEVLRERDGLLTSKAQKVLGLFNSSHVPYTVDRDNDPALAKVTPTLEEMAKKAIENLSKSPKGFLLQIEGARIDHAAHSNDTAGLIYDQLAFEDAVRVAIDFAKRDGETLVVITSDHGNGNPGLNGYGTAYGDANAGLASVLKHKASYGTIMKDLGLKATPAKAAEVVEHRLGVKLTAAESEIVAGITDGKTPYGSSIFYRAANATLGVVLGNHTKITWTSTNHTSDHVMVTAFGPGSEAFHGLTPNTAYFDTILAAKDIRHENPRMTYEVAKPLWEKLKEKTTDG